MTNINSETVQINTSAEQLFNFLSDFNNIQKLMPSSITDWESNVEGGSFTITGMANIGLKIDEKIANTKVKMIRTKAPFDLNLICNIGEVNTTTSTLQILLEADLNMMMKMMAETPLRNFINILANNCQKIFEGA
ncbi:MAG: SRPBCC family protein [Bacteroidia bacterium]